MKVQKQIDANSIELQENSIPFEFPISNIDNVIANIFHIHTEEQVVELSNEFCKYYNATNLDEGTEYFAIVYEEGFLPPIKIIDFLSKNQIPGLNNVWSYSIVNIAPKNLRRLVVIVDKYDFADTLVETVKNKEILSSIQIEKMVKTFVNLMSELDKNGIHGYNIKPSNMIMKNNEFHVLREFIDSYSFFYQEDQFLAPEFLECHKAGRSSYTLLPDIYSLGVTVFFAFIGQEPWEDYKDIADYNNARLEDSSYKSLLGRSKIPERFRQFFRQLLHDNASVRWKISNISEWLKGHNGKNLSHESIVDNKHILGFNDINYSNLKSISYALYNNWEKAIKFARDDKLYKWAGRLEISEDTLEGIGSILGNKGNTAVMLADGLNSNNKISKLLSVLDPQGGIRVEGLGFAPKAIPQMLHYLIVNNKRLVAEQVVKIMKEELWQNFNLTESVGHLDARSELAYKISTLITNTGSAARGIERLVYSLNPEALCLSKLLTERHVTSLHELLSALDAIADREPNKFSIDRHIIAFVASHLGLREDIKPAILPNFPKFSEHPTVQGLSVLNVVQQHEPQIKIPNICKTIGDNLKELFIDHLHNVDFKKEIIANLDEVSKEGELSKIILSLSNQQKFINDYNGYYDACKQTNAIENTIKVLSSEESALNGALLIGQKMTVLTSYILCFIVTITVIM